MLRLVLGCSIAAFCLTLIPSRVAAQVTYDQDWSYNNQKDYYYKKCTFPAGGYQYLIFFKAKPQWVYWYNPGTQVFWCACPTVKHPQFGEDIKAGKDLFLMAKKKDKKIEDTEFPDPGDNGANFKKGKAKDKDGSEVDLTCPPPDLP